MKKVLLALAVLALVLMPMAAMADALDPTFKEFYICDGNKDLDPYPGPYAKVMISVPGGGGDATFEISAFTGYAFGGSQGFAAIFAGSKPASVSFLDISAGANPFAYTYDPNQNVSMFGRFDDFVEQENFSKPATYLKFSVAGSFADASSVLLPNLDGYFIAMHIKVLADDVTGFAGDCPPPQAPIPGSLLLLGTGVLGLIGLRRKL